LSVHFNLHLAPLSLSPNTHLVINFKANTQSTLKRTKSPVQSSLDDFVYEPGNLFQGGFEG